MTLGLVRVSVTDGFRAGEDSHQRWVLRWWLPALARRRSHFLPTYGSMAVPNGRWELAQQWPQRNGRRDLASAQVTARASYRE